MQWWKRSEETGTVLAAVPRFPKSYIRYICTQFYIQWKIVQARERNFCSALRYHFPPKRSHTVSFHWTDSVSLFHSGSPRQWQWSHLHCGSPHSEAISTMGHPRMKPPPLSVIWQWSCHFHCESLNSGTTSTVCHTTMKLWIQLWVTLITMKPPLLWIIREWNHPSCNFCCR